MIVFFGEAFIVYPIILRRKNMYRITVFNDFVALKGKLGVLHPEGWYTTENDVEVEVENGVVTVHKNFAVWTGVLDLVGSFELDELSYKEFKVWKETYEENKGAIAYFLRHDCHSPVDLRDVSFEDFLERKLPEDWKTKLVLRTIEELLNEYKKLM